MKTHEIGIVRACWYDREGNPGPWFVPYGREAFIALLGSMTSDENIQSSPALRIEMNDGTYRIIMAVME